MDSNYNKHDLVKTEHLDNHKFNKGIDTNNLNTDNLNCYNTIIGNSLKIKTITFYDDEGIESQFIELTGDDLDSIFS